MAKKDHDQKQLFLQCDAYETGLGAALLQGGEPVNVGSCALSLPELFYAQIYKECPAIVYGIEKIHHSTYGQKVIVLSDHKPLENIVKKPSLHAPKRLCYFVINHVPGKELLLADARSRA